MSSNWSSRSCSSGAGTIAAGIAAAITGMAMVPGRGGTAGGEHGGQYDAVHNSLLHCGGGLFHAGTARAFLIGSNTRFAPNR